MPVLQEIVVAKKQKKYSITRRTLNALVKLIPAKRRKNVEMGFYDETGFHPIRASADYSESRGSYKTRRTRKTQRKAARTYWRRKPVAR
jgi:hypothetical protein